jgi:hypothetical protein
MTDYAPRATVPGGAVAYSELMTYQPLAMTDWRHGFGFNWHEDAQGYMRTEGSVDTRQSGIACLYTKPVLQYYDTVATGNQGFLQWGGKLYAYGGGSLLEQTSGSSWAEVDTAAGSGGGLSILGTSAYLFYCPDNRRLRKYNGTSFSDAGLNANSKDFHWMIIHSGYIYAGVQNTPNVHFSSLEDLSDLHGLAVEDTQEIVIGAGGYGTIGAMSYAGYLYVSRPDGLWSIGDDRIARKVIDCTNEASMDNFTGLVVHNGYLIFPIKDRVMQWNGTRLVDITPPRVTDTYPFTVYRGFDNLIVIGNYLYLTAKPTTIGVDSTAATDTDLLCFDGVGWFKLATLISGNANYAVTGIGYDKNYRRLYLGMAGTGGTHAREIWYISFDGKSDYPYPYFETSVDTNALITSRIDCGFRRVMKSTPSLLIDASNIDTDRYLKVYYALDGGSSWTSWGNITANGTTELTNPGGNDTIEYNYIQFKFVFYTTNTSQTPILEGAVMRVMLRPDVFYGWNFDIVGATSYQNGASLDQRSAKTIVEQLKTARNSKAPISFVDVYGTTYTAYVSTISIYGLEEHDGDVGGYTDIEYRINVNVVEAV